MLFTDCKKLHTLTIPYQLRGYLEESIDIAAEEARDLISHFREPEYKKSLMLNDENDFVIGFVWGMIIKGLQSYTIMMEKREATQEEMDATFSLLGERMPKIREALFSAG